MYYSVKVTEEYGRGLYCNFPIRKHQVITTCELLILSPNDTETINRTALQHYTFAYDNTNTSRPRECLVLGDGELFNHSDNANVGYVLQDINGRKVMVFYALRDIEIDEQLFINYNSDVEVNIDEYKTSQSLID